MIQTIFLLIVGLALIVKGADWLVDGASAIAHKFGVSELAIGLTIVAFGTSLPELVVSVLASINGNAEFTIGNIVGSNIANILLILGTTAIISPIAVKSNTIWKEIPFSFLGVVVLSIIVHDIFLQTSQSEVISRADGLILLCFFLIYLYYMFGLSRAGRQEDTDGDIPKLNARESYFSILLGMFGLMFGGQLTVNSAEQIATSLGWNETVVGLTVLAIGTSLPELTTSIVAAFKKKTDLAVGNIVGSNIFNIFWILGVTSFISPIHITNSITPDIAVLVIASLAMFVFLFFGKTKSYVIDKYEGLILLFFFFIYIVYNLIRVSV